MRTVALALGMVLCLESSALAGEVSGSWCRSEGGKLADVVSVADGAEAARVELREGWDKPVYAEGVGTLSGSRLTATLKKKADGAIVHAVMTVTGDKLAYSSFNLDGSFRWKGEYQRCKR